jgi:hypothetical protein
VVNRSVRVAKTSSAVSVRATPMVRDARTDLVEHCKQAERLAIVGLVGHFPGGRAVSHCQRQMPPVR